MEDRIKQLRKLSLDRIAIKLKAYRHQYGLSQKSLAKRIGVERSTLLRWENGKTKISNTNLKILVMEGVL